VALASASASALLVTGLVATNNPALVASSNAPHIMIVMMENQGYNQVIGSSVMPYTNALARAYGLATKSYSEAHPSLPNYLAITSGSNQGVTGDEPPSSSGVFSVPTLASQLSAAGYSAKAYAESLPSDPTNSSGLYDVYHDPWQYYASADTIPVSNSSSLVGNLNSSSPPDFVWYTPNLTDDGHTGVPVDTEAAELADADSFLSTFIPSVQSTKWYQSGGQIIIEWDEGLDSDTSGINGASGGHVATIVVSGALAASPVRDASPVDTSGIVRSIEDQYGLPYLADAADAANGSIDSLLGAAASSNRAFTGNSQGTAVAGQTFVFSIGTTGSPTPKLKKRGHLPKGLRFHDNHDGSATIFGTPNPKKAVGNYQVTVVATYGSRKHKQVMDELITLTVLP